MPLYTFFNEKTGEYKDIIMSMNDKHEFIDDSGYKWERVFLCPNMSVDTICDPFSAKDFSKATNKKGTIGSLMDRSAELSEKRGGMTGQDPLKEQYYENYSKKRKGSIHPDVIKRNAKEKLKKMGVSVKE